MAATITPVQLLVTALEMESVNVQTAGEEVRVPEGDTVTGVGATATRSMVYDVGSLCLAKECRKYFTENISSGDADQINMQEVKKVNWTEREGEEKAPQITMVQKNE